MSGKRFEDYLHDMRIIQRFATLNHRAFLRGMKLETAGRFTTVHNYIDAKQ